MGAKAIRVVFALCIAAAVAVAIPTVMPATIPAFADTLPSQQQAGIPTSNSPATETLPVQAGSSAPSRLPYFAPTLLIDYPDQVRVGEVGVIRLNYTFALIDTGLGVDPLHNGRGGFTEAIETEDGPALRYDKRVRTPASAYYVTQVVPIGDAPRLYWPDPLGDSHTHSVAMTHVEGMEILDDGFAEYLRHVAYYDTPDEYHIYYLSQNVTINSDPAWRTFEIPFRITESINQLKPELKIWIASARDTKYIQVNDGMATFVDENPSGITKVPRTTWKDPAEGPTGAAQEPPLPPIESFGKFLVEDGPSWKERLGVANFTQWLLDNTDYPPEYYDELFERYPEIKAQDAAAMPAFADSPLSQWAAGVPLSEIQCSGDHILMEAARAKPACVSQETSERMVPLGWSIVEAIPDLAPPLPEVSDKRIIEVLSGHDATRFGQGGGSAGRDLYATPTLIIDYPEQVRIGEVGVIRLNYTFALIDTGLDDGLHLGWGGLVDEIETGDDPVQLSWPSRLSAPHTFPLRILHDEGVEILDGGFDEFQHEVSYPAESYAYSTYIKQNMVTVNSDPVWHTYEIPFRITESLNQIEPRMLVWILASISEKYIETEDGVATFVDKNPYKVIGGYVPSIPWEKFAKGATGKAAEPEQILPPPIGSLGPFLVNEGEYWKKELGVANFTQWLLDNTEYPPEYYDELFERYPEIKAQDAAAMPAFADSPLSQWDMGVPLSEIQCSGDHILMEAARAKPACVSQETSERMVPLGWSVVERTQSPADAELPEISDRRLVAYPEDTMASAGAFPRAIATIDLPEQVRMGEIGIIRFNYTFAEIDKDDPTRLDTSISQLLPNPHKHYFNFNFPTGVEILNSDPIYHTSTLARGSLYEYKSYRAYVSATSDPNVWNTAEVQFRVNEHLNENNPRFYAGVNFAGVAKFMQTRDGVVTLSDDHPYPNKNLPENFIDPYSRSIPHETPPPYRTLHPVIPLLAEFLKEKIQPTTNAEEWLLEHTDYTQDYYDELFGAYPELREDLAGVAGEAAEPYVVRDNAWYYYIPPEEQIPPPADFFADYLERFVRPIANIEEWVYANTDYPQEYYDELFGTYPELKSQAAAARGVAHS